jgi:hypothetical protein
MLFFVRRFMQSCQAHGNFCGDDPRHVVLDLAAFTWRLCSRPYFTRVLAGLTAVR